MTTPNDARTSCAMVSVTSIPSFSARVRAEGLRRRNGADSHAHALYREDRNVLTAGNRPWSRRGERLNSTVVCQYDRAARALADADDAARPTADQIPQGRRLGPLGAR